MHHAEISHLGDAAKLVRRELPDRREHRDHGIVDPDIDAAAFAGNPVRGFEHRIGIGDVGWNRERCGAEFFRLLLDFIECGGIARNQSEVGAGAGEAQRDGAPDPG